MPPLASTPDTSDFPDDVELQIRPTKLQDRLSEQSISLDDFIRAVLDNPDDIGSAKITGMEVRQSRKWPLYHEYIVLSVLHRGIKWAIRIERTGKQGKGSRPLSLRFLRGGEAVDVVHIIRYDSPDAEAILLNTKSKGSICLNSLSHCYINDYFGVETDLLFACWIPSYQTFAATLNAAFIPEYEKIYPASDPVPRVDPESEKLYGYVLLDRRTLLILSRFVFQWPITARRRRLRLLFRQLSTRYFDQLKTRFNRMAVSHRIESCHGEYVLEFCRRLPYRMATLLDLSTSLSIISKKYPTYSLHRMNCSLFCHSVYSMKHWMGYEVTKSVRRPGVMHIESSRFDRYIPALHNFVICIWTVGWWTFLILHRRSKVPRSEYCWVTYGAYLAPALILTMIFIYHHFAAAVWKVNLHAVLGECPNIPVNLDVIRSTYWSYIRTLNPNASSRSRRFTISVLGPSNGSKTREKPVLLRRTKSWSL